jgi:hypothetical protein
MMVRRGRRRKQLLDDLSKKRVYWKLTEEALDGAVRRTRLGKVLWTRRKTDYARNDECTFVS